MMLPSDLIRNADGSVYHLSLHPHEIADKIILVGDQGRVDRVARYFDSIELTRQHREFRSTTGQKDQQRLTVLSTGIGTGNIDIVWQELDALANYDWSEGSYRSTHRSLKVLRLGTCGGLQPSIPVGTLVHSRYAIGGDALMAYYQPQRRPPAASQALTHGLISLTAALHPQPPRWYGSQCAEPLDELLTQHFPDIRPGLTFTAPGFYGPQGRDLGRIGLAMPDLIPALEAFSFDGLQVLNLEMETAAILALGHALGHQAGSLSVILAQRSQGAFHPQPHQAIDDLVRQGLQVMLAWS
jgi:uridine phosphorylase